MCHWTKADMSFALFNKMWNKTSKVKFSGLFLVWWLTCIIKMRTEDRTVSWMDDLLEYSSIMGDQLMMNHFDEFNLQLWPTFWYSNSGHCYIEFMHKHHITKLQKKFPYCFKQFYDFVLGHIQFSLVTYSFQWPVGFTLDMSGTINIFRM